MGLKAVSVPGELIKLLLINIKVAYLPGLDFRKVFDCIPIQKDFREVGWYGVKGKASAKVIAT